MLNILKIKRSELVPALVALVLVVGLNAVMTCYEHQLFTKVVKGGWWTIFWGHYHVSGFDSFTLLTLSNWDAYYTAFRHPLLPFLWWPLAMLNHWLMPIVGVNLAVYLVAAVMTVAGLYSFLFLYRLLGEVVELSRQDALLVAALFFSLAYVMLSLMVADHFGLSLTLLLLTAYVCGRQMKSGQPQPWWHTAVLFIATAGVTLSNGAKVLLGAWWTRGRRIFQPRYMLLGIVLPVVATLAIDVWQNEAYVKPHIERGERVRKANEKKYPAKAKKNRAFEKHIAEVQGEKMEKKGVLAWTDLSVARWPSIRHNIMGEGMQLHRQHALQDIYHGRPIFVSYDWWMNDLVELLLVAVTVVSLWLGRRSRLLWMLLSWMSIEVVIHLVLGFGLNEAYIMTAHWAFIIPVAIAEGMRRLQGTGLTAMRMAVLFLAVFLWVWNGRTIVEYMVG